MCSLALIFATLVAVSPPTITSSLGIPFIIVHAPKATLHLEIANTEQEREQGLMNRVHLEPHSGMIFVFPVDQQVDFWMKNTLISLDMVFVDSDGRVRQVTAHVPTVSPSLPDAEIPLEPGNARYVIELAAGEAERDGIVPGVILGNITAVPPAR